MATRSKKIFSGIMILFFAGLVALAVDISRKTSFPGAKKRQEAREKARQDSLTRNSSPEKATQPK